MVDKVSRARERVWEGKLWMNSWVVLIGRGELFQQNLPNKPVGLLESFLRFFLLIMSNNFRYQPFVTASGNFWKERLSC